MAQGLTPRLASPRKLHPRAPEPTFVYDPATLTTHGDGRPWLFYYPHGARAYLCKVAPERAALDLAWVDPAEHITPPRLVADHELVYARAPHFTTEEDERAHLAAAAAEREARRLRIEANARAEQQERERAHGGEGAYRP